MKVYILRRLLLTIPLLLGISFVSFVIIQLSPSDPAEVAVRVNEIVPTEEVLALTREQLGLNKPFLVRYADWMCAVAHGDLSVTIDTVNTISQPGALSGGQTAATANSTISIQTQSRALRVLEGSADLMDVVKGLNALGATPQDLMVILQALKAAGSLRAELEII